MTTVAVLVLAIVWVGFLLRGYRLARSIDRAETMVLRPSAISYFVVAVASVASRNWPLAIAAAVACGGSSMIGASLHNNATFRELAADTGASMLTGARLDVSHEEGRLIARVHLGTATMLGLVLTAYLLMQQWRWFFAVPIGFVVSFAVSSAHMGLAVWRFDGGGSNAAG